MGQSCSRIINANSQGQEKLCWRFVSHLLCWFPHTVGLENTDVRQKVSASCGLSHKSSRASTQCGASLYDLSCVNAFRWAPVFLPEQGRLVCVPG